MKKFLIGSLAVSGIAVLLVTAIFRCRSMRIPQRY